MIQVPQPQKLESARSLMQPVVLHPEHMGDKRKPADAPTVRPLNVVSLRTTVAQVDLLLAYAYRSAFFISWSKRLLGCSAPLRSAPPPTN